VSTNVGKEFVSHNVLLAIGRRGSPRKLGVPGEELPNVAYRLLEPENISGKRVVVVGGGDSAVESAMLLMDTNTVLLSYRSDQFARIKPKNKEAINAAVAKGVLKVAFKSDLVSIAPDHVMLKEGESARRIPNDLVYIFAGGELPTSFLQKAGVEITKRFAHIAKKHK